MVVTGPIAAGKNTVADHLAQRLTVRGRTVVVADVDDVAAMVARPGAAEAGLWFAAHEAHGALVGRWMRSAVDVVVVVGPIYSPAEQAALDADPAALWVVVEAAESVTLARAQSDPGRGRSKDPDFHHAAYRRYQDLRPAIPADLTFDSADWDAARIADAIADLLTGAGRTGR